MASRGEYVPGTDGSDHSFRQRVDPFYQNVTYFKAKVATFGKIHTLGLIGLFAYVSFLERGSPFHLGLLLTLLLPLISDKAAKSNSAGLMLVYNVMAGLTAAYIILVGVGRQLDLVTSLEHSIFEIIVIALSIIVASLFLLGGYYSRRLITVWRDREFELELKRSRAGGASSATSKDK
jgi:hypothetical protein